MDRLWTPWRFEYIRNADKEISCVFCRILNEACDRENLVLFRGKYSFILMNLYPYTSGHLLVVANRHISFLNEALPQELTEIIRLGQRCEVVLAEEYHPHGYNMGFNLGRAAGAGVDHHLHMHVVPRWTGDSNFVSIVGETRTLPEELPSTYERLIHHFKEG